MPFPGPLSHSLATCMRLPHPMSLLSSVVYFPGLGCSCCLQWHHWGHRLSSVSHDCSSFGRWLALPCLALYAFHPLIPICQCHPSSTPRMPPLSAVWEGFAKGGLPSGVLAAATMRVHEQAAVLEAPPYACMPVCLLWCACPLWHKQATVMEASDNFLQGLTVPHCAPHCMHCARQCAPCCTPYCASEANSASFPYICILQVLFFATRTDARGCGLGRLLSARLKALLQTSSCPPIVPPAPISHRSIAASGHCRRPGDVHHSSLHPPPRRTVLE